MDAVVLSKGTFYEIIRGWVLIPVFYSLPYVKEFVLSLLLIKIFFKVLVLVNLTF